MVSSSILANSEEEIGVGSIIVKSEVEDIFESLEGSSCFWSASGCSNINQRNWKYMGSVLIFIYQVHSSLPFEYAWSAQVVNL
jgi:hypothetical protein